MKISIEVNGNITKTAKNTFTRVRKALQRPVKIKTISHNFTADGHHINEAKEHAPEGFELKFHGTWEDVFRLFSVYEQKAQGVDEKTAKILADRIGVPIAMTTVGELAKIDFFVRVLADENKRELYIERYHDGVCFMTHHLRYKNGTWEDAFYAEFQANHTFQALSA